MAIALETHGYSITYALSGKETFQRLQAIELKRIQDQLNTIVTHIKDGILVVDSYGVIQFANPASAQMFNLPLSNLIGCELGRPIVEKKVTRIDILQPNGDLGAAEITVAEAKWADQPVSIVCLRDVSDR